MKRIAICGTAALMCVLTNSLLAKDGPSKIAETPRIYVSGDALVIRNTVLLHQTVDDAIETLDSHPEIKRVWLIDVPGGYAIPGARLAWRVQDLEVIVGGGCYSACANVALSAKTLRVAPGAGQMPAAILVHGSFDMDGEWNPKGLNNLTRYAERLEPIQLADVEQALRFPYPSASGLYIFTDGTVSQANGHTSLLCSYFPSKCKDLGVSLTQLRIQTTDLPIPAPPDRRTRR